MIRKLSKGVLLIAVLLMLYVPAHGQSIQQTSSDVHSAAVSKASFHSISATRLDLPDEISLNGPEKQGFTASWFASALIEILASKNTISLDGMPSGRMDAYLRPPQAETDHFAIFRQAKSLYDDATSIRTNRAQVSLDPLSLRCSLRIKLGRALSN